VAGIPIVPVRLARNPKLGEHAMLISKLCDNFDDANAFYLTLCEKYMNVKIQVLPLRESGIYVWLVETKGDKYSNSKKGN
jgi:hypothetical protein